MNVADHDDIWPESSDHCEVLVWWIADHCAIDPSYSRNELHALANGEPRSPPLLPLRNVISGHNNDQLIPELFRLPQERKVSGMDEIEDAEGEGP